MARQLTTPRLLAASLIIAGLSLNACASGPDKKRAAPARAMDVGSQSEAILNDARKRKAKGGCAHAIPSYRVAAAFGKGHDVAQFELGDCLIEITADKTGADATLLKDEGVLWLRRAAYAGNARAQHALAELLSGTEKKSTTGLVEAYGWSLIYADNAAHKLYGLPAIAQKTNAHFKAHMTPAMVKEANSFAADFTRIELDAFVPPARAGGSGMEGRARPGGGKKPGGGQQRRRPQATEPTL